MTMGNKRKLVLLSSLAAVGFLSPQATAKTTPPCVQTAISMTIVNQPFDFAIISACTGTAGTVRIAPANGARTTGGCITGVGGTPARADIRIKGNNANGRMIVVTITNANSATVATGTKSMSVTAIQMKQGAPTYSFAAQLTKTVNVGGTLNVGSGQALGTYTGTFTINAVCI